MVLAFDEGEALALSQKGVSAIGFFTYSQELPEIVKIDSSSKLD